MSVFHFKHFSIQQDQADLKVGTDAMLLGAFAKFHSPSTILDIGTGTGVLSLMMAQKYPNAIIDAFDLSEKAVLIAGKNFNENILGKNCSIHHTSLQEFQTKQLYDGIISNPPYFEDSMKSEVEGKTLARHTDSLSFEDLIIHCKRLLSIKGSAWIIIPYSQIKSISLIAQKHLLNVNELITIESKTGQVVRAILQISHQQKELIEKTFVIRDKDNQYSLEYVELTKEFHNKSVR